MYVVSHFTIRLFVPVQSGDPSALVGLEAACFSRCLKLQNIFVVVVLFKNERLKISYPGSQYLLVVLLNSLGSPLQEDCRSNQAK